MSELGDSVSAVREQAEGVVQKLQADAQSGTDFIEGMSGVQNEVDKAQAQLRRVAETVEGIAGMMASLREKSSLSARATSEHAVDVVRLLNGAVDVTADSGNPSARTAVENIDSGYNYASNSSQLHGRVKHNTNDTADFLNEVQATAGSLAAQLATFQERTTTIQATASQAVTDSENAAERIEAAATELANYQSAVE